MEIFIARQPIFNRNKRVFGYELLYRNSNVNKFANIDGDIATRKLLSNAAVLELDKITEGKKAFINFTQNTLIEELPTLLPKETVVVEILEDVELTDDVITACKKLKNKGYTIAVDDFANDRDITPLIGMLDIVKVDFSLTTEEQQKEICSTFKKLGIKVLAEKVENSIDFEKALDVGYDYFQGFFFSKPKIISGKHSPVASTSFVIFMRELKKSDVSLESLEQFIISDASLSYKLIKYINSAHFGIPNRIKSVRQAITLLGIKELEKWVILLSFNLFTDPDYEELSKNAMVRAHFCEALCEAMGNSVSASAFMVGLFSHLDVVLSTDMETLLEELPVDEEIKRALIKKDNFLYEILDISISYESMDVDKLMIFTEKHNIAIEKLSNIYIDSLEWVGSMNE
ncbi:HDOD domain-containing protein [Clostridium sp. C8-1-8]|uniref:EAL and HDOD domain-containing protein n=1 Tax=Clostridium sp. C8-1-8 TaxID=2698831 RepID=UPI00136928E0|nr:HDOD domain-containing protein [Clostridium sp. C8-1-8]